MDRRIRVLAVVLIGCFGVLFVQLNNLQIRLAPALETSPYQPRSTVDPFTLPRGEIVSSDGTVLAYSTPTTDGDGEQRHYPDGKLFADVTGYYDVVDTAAPQGIEAEYDNYLSYHEVNASNLHELLTNQSGADTVVLTISAKLQAAARAALASECPAEPGGCTGAVVAIDPRNGDVLAMYGNPTYDPNLLSSHDAALVHKTYNALANPVVNGKVTPSASPLINFATGQLIAPGSTMKVITTSAIFDRMPSLASSTWPDVSTISLPETNNTLSNFDNEKCGGALAYVLAHSCDTSFAKIGLQLGAENLAAEAQAFGFDSRPPLDLPASEVQAAQFPTAVQLAQEGLPFVAYSAIGQGNVQESALTDALVAAALGNGGEMMTPHLLAHVIDGAGDVVTSYQPKVWKDATSQSTAAEVRVLMRGVVESGTAAGVFNPALHVAAKTGTAETLNGCSANWMIATAPADPTDTPTIAVAAVVPFQPGLSCGDTGATIAGPVVAKVIAAALGGGATK